MSHMTAGDTSWTARRFCSQETRGDCRQTPWILHCLPERLPGHRMILFPHWKPATATLQSAISGSHKTCYISCGIYAVRAPAIQGRRLHCGIKTRIAVQVCIWGKSHVGFKEFRVLREMMSEQGVVCASWTCVSLVNTPVIYCHARYSEGEFYRKQYPYDWCIYT